MSWSPLIQGYKNKLKVGLVRLAYSPFGGAETSIEALIKSVQTPESGIQFHLLTSSWDSKNKIVSDGMVVHQIRLRGLTRCSRYKSFLVGVEHLAREHRWDILQSHERTPNCSVFRAGDGLHASWLARLSAARGLPISYFKIDAYHRLILANELAIARNPMPIVVANSNLVRDEFINILGTDPSKIRVIPNVTRSINKSLVSSTQKRLAKLALGLDENAPMILFVGSGFERKGALQLVNAARLLKHAQVVIVGKDRNVSTLAKQIKKWGIEGRVFITGPEVDVNPYLAAADVFCLPSLYDSFPNAALEALASGVPCVVTEGVGTSLEWQKNGAAMMSTREPASIALAIAEILGDLHRYQKCALDTAHNYLPSKVAPLWKALYEEVRDRR